MKERVRHGKLVTIRKVQKSQKKPHIPAKWLCKCDCGNEKIIHECNLYGKGIQSCGCVGEKRFGIYRFTKEFILERVKIDKNGCWIWLGNKHKQGYGALRYKKKYALAHRVSWEIYMGEIPKGIKVCHKCDVTSCCNPEHLFLGTQKDNVIDAIDKGKFKNRKLGKRRNKLNYEQVQEIKELHKQGMTRKDLQIKYEVSQTCIAKILTGISWNVNWTKEI